MIIREKPVEKPPDSRPSLGQLKAWESDEITMWIIKQLHNKFPSYEQLLPVKQPESALMLNYRVGARHVLEALARLVEHGEV